MKLGGRSFRNSNKSKSPPGTRPISENSRSVCLGCIRTGGAADTETRLVHRGRRLQIDLLPLPLDDSGTNLGCGLALPVLFVGVIQLFQAGRTLGSVGILKTAVQTVVTHPVAITVTGLLMDYVGDLGRQLVRVSLKGILGILTPQIRLGQDRRQLCALGRRPGVVGRDAAHLLR